MYKYLIKSTYNNNVLNVSSKRLNSTIINIKAREIIDSRGNPTLEVDLTTKKGLFRASVPSGASTGIHEACELRDGDKKRYNGKGVLKAVNNVNTTILNKLRGMDVTKQNEIDNVMITLDGTANKSNLGANAILGVSLAVSKAGAAARDLPLFAHLAQLSGDKSGKFVLPVPAFNVINGGSHAGNRLAFQEFMVLPVGARSFSEALQCGCEVYSALKTVIKQKYGQDAVNVGDEGGFAPGIRSNAEGLELLLRALRAAGCESIVRIGMDVAASEFFCADSGMYDLDFKAPAGDKDPRALLTGDQLAQLYVDLIKQYPIVSVEDPFEQDDFESYAKFTAAVGSQVQVVGDDLLCTQTQRISRARDSRACNALLLKVNQVGSVSEAVSAVKLAQSLQWGVMTSHRSGETEDSYIADLAVGLRTGQIKTGAPCRSERLSKYNQLLRIEELLGKDALFAGHSFRLPAAMA